MPVNTDRVKVEVACENNRLPFRKKVSMYFSEFTTSTSLHGLKYIGDIKRTGFERTLWTVVILTSIITCICLLSNTYIKWMNTPIILVEDREGHPVSSIPFPAVTICPENKINQSIYNFTHSIAQWRKTNIAEEQLNISLLLCDDLAGDTLLALKSNETQTIDTREFIYNVNKQMSLNDDLLDYCKWGMTVFECDDHFVKSFTEDGVCHTFNGLSREHIFADDVIPFRDFGQHHFSITGWSSNEGYNDPKDKHTYPRRLFQSGATSGLSFFLFAKEEYLDFACRNLPEAHKIILHYPTELPRAEKFTGIAMTSVMVEAGKDVSIALVPKVITTSESLRKYSPKRRGCYYPNEKRLRYFKGYTQQKCEYECIQNFTLSLCRCSAYYMPMVDDIPICRANSAECIQTVKEGIASGDIDPCKCLPTCSSISYSAEVSHYSYDVMRRFEALNMDISNISTYQVSRVTIFFKESHYFINKRSELYSITEFISNCGGLFGLFVGFSIISLLEAVYFATIRVIVNCRRYGKNRWYGSNGFVEDRTLSAGNVPTSTIDKIN